MQSLPIGEKGVRGSTHPPPELKKEKKVRVSYAQLELGTLTALKIMCSIDTLPGPGSSAKHAAGRPAMPLLCARAAANPTPLIIGDSDGRARARSHTVAIANHVGSRTATHGWIDQGISREAIRTSESAGVSIDARWYAVIGVVAGRRCMAGDLKNKMRSGTFL